MEQRSTEGRNASPIHEMRKGVSPLIAAVLLIAFTMAVAAILTAWVTTFTQEQTQTVENQSDQVIECSYASLSVYDSSWDDSNDKVYVTVANTGNVDFNNVTVIVFKNAVVEGSGYIDGLQTSGIKSVENGIDYTLGTQPDKIRVSSSKCPSASAEETNIGTS
jgi:flagellin-like protein